MRTTLPTRDPPLERLRRAALDIIFPPRCAGCREWGALICEPCGRTLVNAPPGRRTPRLHEVRSVYHYDGVAREAVHALKFRGLTGLVPQMARPMAQALIEWNPRVSCIVPVPLSSARYRERGFNQSEDLARYISRVTGVPLRRRMLKRIRNTKPQSSLPDQYARWDNVHGAFRATGPVRGYILVIDDVISTGATVDECARALLDAGAGSVSALSYARGSASSPAAR